MALTKVKASNITLTTAAANSNDTTPATTQYVTTAINNLIDGAPATLNTLDEIAAALNDDAALNTTLTNAIAAKLPLAGGTLTGALTMSDPPTINNARVIVQRANDDSSITFANNASGTPSSHTWAIGLDYSASNGLSIAYSASGIPSLTGSNLVQIDTTGKVGIGTSAPLSKLAVADDNSFSGADGQIVFSITPSVSNTESAGMAFGTYNDNDYWKQGIFWKRTGSYGRGELHFANRAAADSTTVSISDSKMMIDEDGNVGIGTSSISSWAKLQVAGTAGAQDGAKQALYIQSPTTTANEGVGIRMSAASGSHEAVGIIGMVNNASGNSGSMTFHTYNGGATIPEAMRITNLGSVGIGTSAPTEALEVNGSILCSNFTDEEGIFFRSGFSSTNKYNVSIMAKDHNGSSADGISINGYDGISFCTGSNTRNEVVRITGGTSNTGDVLIGTLVNPVGTGLAVNAAINTSSTTAIEIQQSTSGANKAAAALGIAIQNGGASTNAADLLFYTASGGSIAERVRITSAGSLAPRHASGQGYLSFTHVKGGGNYINVKTNIYRASKMYMLKLLGHISYSGERIDTIITGYAYNPNAGQTTSTYHGITNHGTVGIAVYYSSDDYLCFRTTSGGSYNSIDIIGSSGANGYFQGGPIEILAYTSIAGTGNHYA